MEKRLKLLEERLDSFEKDLKMNEEILAELSGTLINYSKYIPQIKDAIDNLEGIIHVTNEKVEVMYKTFKGY